MKNILFGLVALSTVAMADNLYLKVGTTFNEKFDTITGIMGNEFNERDSEDRGYELSTEYTHPISERWELGLGISYQNHDKPEGKEYFPSRDSYIKFDLPEFESIPVYMTLKYNVPVEWEVKPFFKVDFGYSFNDCDNGTMSLGMPQPQVSREVINGVDRYNIPLNYDVNNGIYYGIGAGLEFKNAFISLMYKVNTAEVEMNRVAGLNGNNPHIYTAKQDMNFERVVLEFGYRFDI